MRVKVLVGGDFHNALGGDFCAAINFGEPAIKSVSRARNLCKVAIRLSVGYGFAFWVWRGATICVKCYGEFLRGPLRVKCQIVGILPLAALGGVASFARNKLPRGVDNHIATSFRSVPAAKVMPNFFRVGDLAFKCGCAVVNRG